MGVTVIDDFLPIDEFKNLQKTIISNNFPVYFCDRVARKDETQSIYDINFTHSIYKNNIPTSPWYDMVKQILLSKLEIRSLIRSKINCYPRTDKIIEHSWHIDYRYEHSGIIFYLNTCNGKTKFEKDTIKSKENRIVFFDPSKLHASTSCTDQKCRWNIIANYF